jgi:hypothetical protein
VHDERRDDWICTNCGAVVRQWYYSNCHRTFSETEAPPTAKQSYTIRSVLNLQSIQVKANAIACKEDVKKDRFIAFLYRVATIMELGNRTAETAEGVYRRTPELQQRRPVVATVVALLVVTERSFGRYVNMREVSAITNTSKMGGHVIAVCKILGVSQRSDPANSINKYISIMRFPFKYGAHLLRLYKKTCVDNGSLGTDTVMALVIYRFFKSNREKSDKTRPLTLEDIARMTDTSVPSLRGYIDGTGGKCTIFRKARERALERARVKALERARERAREKALQKTREKATEREGGIDYMAKKRKTREHDCEVSPSKRVKI